MAHLRPSRRRAVRWPTWVWSVGLWGWMAQAVLQRDGGFGPATAQAALGRVADELAPAWAPPVPAYRPKPLPVRDVVSTPSQELVGQLTQRGPSWKFLSDSLREEIDQAVVPASGRASWRRIIVEGTGEQSGGARDMSLALRRRPVAPGSDPGYLDAHFVIRNGPRSQDGRIERTSRPIPGDVLVVALVGDFSQQEPSAAQLHALTELVDYARAKTGVIPVKVGEASRAPLAPSVLHSAFNAGLAGELSAALPTT